MVTMTEDAIFDRASAYIEDDGAGGEVAVYRASALGHCVGAMVRARLGITGSAPPDFMQQRFDEGHDWEARVIAAGLGVDWTLLDTRKLRQYGTVVEGEHGEVQVETELRFGSPPKVIRCHPDGIAVHGSRVVGGDADGGNMERRVVEAKFFGSDLYEATVNHGLSYSYAMQLSIEMLSTGLKGLYIIGEKLRDKETDEVSLGDVTVVEYDTPPFKLAEVKMRVLEVEGWVARGEMPPCPVPFDYPCPYWADHDAPEKVAITDDLMQKLVAAYEVIVEEKEYIAEAEKLTKQQMMERLEELGVKGGGCAGWTATVVTPTQGNVSWSRAYKALSKQTGEQVEVDEYRGDKGAPYLAMKKDTTDG